MTDLYSTNTALPESTRLMLRALEATKGDRFQTSFYLKDKESGTQSVAWREAWRNPVTSKWEVTEHGTLIDFYPGQEGQKDSCAERRHTLHNNLCFFDALYQCALFEVSERKFGHEKSQKKYRPGQKHYVEFAEREGVPFDKTGMPLLAAYGRILSDGDYDQKAHEIAERSPLDLQLAKAPSIAMYGSAASFPAGNLPALLSDKKDLAAQRQSIDFKKRAASLTAKMDKVIDLLKESVKTSNFENHYCAAAIVPLIPIIGQIGMLVAIFNPTETYETFFAASAYSKNVRKVKKEYNKISGADADPMDQFVQDAAMTHQILKARCAARFFVRDKMKEKAFNKYIAEFKSYAAAQGWDNDKVEHMVSLIKYDADSKDFDNELISKLAQSKNKIISYLEKSAEVPALPRPSPII